MTKAPKTRNNNTWTESRYRSFIRSTLRRASMRWGPINKAKKDAWVERGKYFCAGCKKVVPLTLNGKKNVFVDHINGVVDTKDGFQGWDVFIERLFCESDGLQVLCKECHDKVSAEEREERKNFK